MPIEAIVFDLDGTLRTSQPTFNQAFFDFLTRRGVDVERSAQIRMLQWQHYYWAQSVELAEDRLSFDADETGFWTNHARRNLEVFGLQAKDAHYLAPEIIHYYSTEFEPEDVLFPDTIQTLEMLRSAGYRLALLSNRSEPCQEYLEELGIDSFLEFSVVAGEVDLWKPDAGIFRHVCRRLGCAPENTLYIGDNYFADILGARQVGWHTVLMDPEQVFPDADCQVIHSLAELPALLEQSKE